MINESKNYNYKVTNIQLKNLLVGMIKRRHKWDSVKKTLTTAVEKCQDMDDIKFLRNDLRNSKPVLNKLLSNTEKEEEKEKLKEHIEWLNNDYVKLINERAKKLRMSENVELIMVESSLHMPHNSSHMETLENAITKIQSGSSTDEMCRKIQLAINKEFNANCQGVYVIDNNTNNYFFGACIIPTEEECYKIIDNLTRGDENVKFERCSSFIINLDSKLLYDVAATPKEIVAVLLHEIGHKTFSSLQKVKLKEKLIEVSMEEGIEPSKMKQTYIGCKYILMTPVINCFTSCFSSIGLLNEIGSDSFAVRYGYGRELASLIKKLMELDTRKNLFRKDRKVDEDTLLVKWSVTSMINFAIRRKAILRDLQSQTKGEMLMGIPKLIDAQIKSLSNTRVNTRGLSVSRKFNNESVKSFIEMKTKGLSQLELDEIIVEIDRIEYHEDKLYLVNRIHKDIMDCNKEIDSLSVKMKKTGNFKLQMRIDELNEFKKQLVELTDKVKNTKIIEKDFEIRVHYPEGYKG